jgi:hypothetical protein
VVYAVDVSLLAGNVSIIKKNTEALIDASKKLVYKQIHRKLSTYLCLVIRLYGKIVFKGS